MAEKLKSILKQIHWSLLLRTAIFSLAWLFLPFWLFLIIALYLYVTPLFNTGRLFWLFFAVMVLAYLEPTHLIYALILAALFYYLLLLKDLLLIDRKSAYEVLAIAVSFLLMRGFYENVGNRLVTGWSLFDAFLLATLIGVLVNGFIKNFSDSQPDSRNIKTSRRIAGWVSFIVTWQFLLLGLLLPIDFVYQSVIVFLVSVLTIDLVSEQTLAHKGVSRERIMASGVTVGILLAIAVVSARWSF